MLITLLGVYSIRNSVFDMQLVIALGALGYLMKKLGLEPGPLVLAFVLGGLLEKSFRQSMRIFDGDLTEFVGTPDLGLAARRSLPARHRRSDHDRDPPPR